MFAQSACAGESAERSRAKSHDSDEYSAWFGQLAPHSMHSGVDGRHVEVDAIDVDLAVLDNRDYPRSVMPDALCCWVFISHRRWTMRELRLG